jgi:tRNA A37 threonylcarbamoyltransferase TsaD
MHWFTGCGMLLSIRRCFVPHHGAAIQFQRAADEGLEIHFPPPGLLTDNALMIAFAAAHHLAAGHHDPIETEITPNFNPDALRRSA